MIQHPVYKNQTRNDVQAALCQCGGIKYWHATVEGGGCEDCDCPEFTPAGDEAPTTGASERLKTFQAADVALFDARAAYDAAVKTLDDAIAVRDAADAAGVAARMKSLDAIAVRDAYSVACSLARDIAAAQCDYDSAQAAMNAAPSSPPPQPNDHQPQQQGVHHDH